MLILLLFLLKIYSPVTLEKFQLLQYLTIKDFDVFSFSYHNLWSVHHYLLLSHLHYGFEGAMIFIFFIRRFLSSGIEPISPVIKAKT